MNGVIGGANGLLVLPKRVLRKARQGPGPVAAALAYHLWTRGPVFRMRRALAMRGLHAAGTDGAAARCPYVPGLVSVVLPVFNQADLLGDSIESVLGQTYPDYELIVVDDGSEDEVERVLRRYLGHSKIRILRQANQKLPAALSNGFDFARGEFWTWTSADNLMRPEQLARLVTFLDLHPDTAMVYADYVAIDDRGEPLADPSFRPHNRRPATSPEIHLTRNPREINVIRDNFIGPCFLYRSLVGRLIGDYDPGLGIEDYDYWMRVNHVFRIEHLGTEETLYQYRVHDRCLSGRAVELKIAERAAALMRTERARHLYYNKPWTVVVDAPMKLRLAGCTQTPHRWLDLESDPDTPDRGVGDERKVLYLADSTGLEALASSGRPESSVVAAWFDDIDETYERRVAAAKLDAVGFAGRREVAERLDLVGIKNVVVESAESLLKLATKYANNSSFFARHRSESERRRMTPEPSLADGSRHVLIQVDDFQQGGLENVVIGLARGLVRRGLRVSLLVLGHCGPAVNQARAAGLRVATIDAHRRESAYRDWLIGHRVDLVCAHYSTFGAIIAADVGVPFVQVVHNTYVWLGERAVDAYRAADDATTGYICVSAEVARYCDRRIGLAVDKMIVVPNGVDLRRLDAAKSQVPERLRGELGLSADDFVFLNVASIHATKAQVLLLKALARVVEDWPQVHLVIAGAASDAEYERRLRRRIADLRLEQNVRLTGQRADIARFYWMADAFVLPSLWEGWSLALTEAAYTGLPLVATAVGGAADIVPDGAGRLIHPPFATICDVDAGAISRLVREEDPRFIDDLAQSMSAIAASSRRSPLPDEKRWLLSEERMIDVHFRILAWLLQGGQASAARTWSRPAVNLGGDRSGARLTRAAVLQVDSVSA
jgi:glycosyltransferase involved in cell wall biosynthesis